METPSPQTSEARSKVGNSNDQCEPEPPVSMIVAARGRCASQLDRTRTRFAGCGVLEFTATASTYGRSVAVVMVGAISDHELPPQLPVRGPNGGWAGGTGGFCGGGCEGGGLNGGGNSGGDEGGGREGG